MKRATLLPEAIVLATILLFSLSKANAQSEGPDGHYYKIVLEPNLPWETARTKAAESTFNGLHGYLATITSYDEDKFIETLRVRAGSNSVLWAGGYRPLNNSGTSGSDGWSWVNGEGRIPSENGTDLYSNWLGSEPNSGSDSERFLAIGRDNLFGWSSEDAEGKIQGYVIEYPGAGTATKVSVTTIDPIAVEDSLLLRPQADIATFEFKRAGNLSLDLPVFYSVSGTAMNGVDYDEISRSIIIPAGESSVRLNIVPRVDDAQNESMETVGIRIEPSLILTPEAAYDIDLRLREAGAVIYERGAPEGGALQLAVPRGSTTYAEGEAVVLLAALSSPKEFSTVDFLAITPSLTSLAPSLVTNKIGSATAMSRTNELAFYRFVWTSPVRGEISIIAVASSGDTRLVSLPLRIVVQGPVEPPVVRIRSVPFDSTGDVLPTSDFATGYFEVTRPGSTAGNLQVHYSIGGTATAGVDYEALQNYVVIGAGRASAKILVTAIDDKIPEPTESVVLSLVAPENVPPIYVVDSTNREATVRIVDNDPVPITPVVSVIASRPETAEPSGGVNAEPGQFALRRTGPTNESLRVFFRIEGTATMGSDYSALPNFVDFLSGQEGVRLNVTALADNLVEGDETVILKLALPPQEPGLVRVPYSIDPNNPLAVVTIHDRPRPTDVVVSVEATRPETIEPGVATNPDMAELIAPGEFTFRRTGSTSNSLVIHVGIGGTATLGLDYTGLSNRVQFPAGKSEVTANVLPFADNLVEGDETAVVELNLPPVDSTIAGGTYLINPEKRRAVVTIHDRPPQPTNVVVSVEATRPETFEPRIDIDSSELIAPGEFTFRRRGSTNNSLNVFFVLAGTATAGLDYNGISNRIEFPAGKSEVKANVFPFADNLVEGDETVVVELTRPPNDSVIGAYAIDPDRRRAVVTIHDRTPQPPTNIVVSVEATRPETSEPGINTVSDPAERIAPGEFTFRRKGSTNNSLNVFYALGGTATVGLDYNGLSNRIEFPAGKSEVKANVFPFADNLVEGDETVVVELTRPPNDSVISAYNIDLERRRAVVTIHDRTPQPPTNVVVSVDATVPETSEPGIGMTSGPGDGPISSPGEFTFRRTGSTSNSLNVFVAIGGTATLERDYTGLSNRVEFPAGESEVKAFVAPFADNLVEGDETAVVELTIPREDPAIFPIIGGYTIDPDKRRAVVTIHDRTPTNFPIVSVEATRPETWEPGRNDIVTIPGEFTIRRRGPTNVPLAVHFVLDGSAKLGADYTTDTNVIEFLPGQSEVVRLVTALADELVEEDETVVMRLLDRPETYTVNNEGPRAVVTIHDRTGTNVPPKVAIVRPADGATFIQGETVRVVVEAADRDGIAKLELLVDGVVADSVEGPRLETSLADLALGGHLLLGRATDNSNLVSTSAPVRILIRHRDAVCFVKRNLPDSYAPGVTLTVELRATPPEGTHAYAVEDQPPAGWQVGEISHNGVFDPISRKVKFGPYTDSENRLLTYRLRPPTDATGRHSFAGSSSVNGALYPICGDETLEPMRQFHPADMNQDFIINLSEVTAYAAAWKAGDSWPVGPNPIPLNYVTRAALIWRRGEQYIFDPSQGPAPACWVPSGGSSSGILSALAVSTAERTIPDFQPGIAALIQVAANPPGTAASYAIEEKPPRGWTVANISHGGVFDSDTGVIRWGVFFDATPRTLTYTLTPPAGVSCLGDFSGEFSYDGSLVDILSASVVIEAPTPIQITGVAAGLDSVSLEITGPAGQTAVIESSSDFVNWTEVQSIFIPDGEIGFKTEPPAPGALFYRLRVR